MDNLRFRLFWGFFLLAVVVLPTYGQEEIVDPQIKAQQAMQKKRAEESGYGDIEIDLLHKSIKETLRPIIDATVFPNRDEFIQEEGGVTTITLPIAQGESIKSISERYIYNGTIVIETDGEGSALKTVKLVFERTNPFGVQYKKEKRELINKTPNWDAEFKKIDSNNDLELIYYETPEEKEQIISGEREFSAELDDKFNEIQRFVLADIDVNFFDKKMRIVQTYKKYLRRTHKMLKRKVKDINLKRRVRVQHLLELQ